MKKVYKMECIKNFYDKYNMQDRNRYDVIEVSGSIRQWLLEHDYAIDFNEDEEKPKSKPKKKK